MQSRFKYIIKDIIESLRDSQKTTFPGSFIFGVILLCDSQHFLLYRGKPTKMVALRFGTNRKLVLVGDDSERLRVYSDETIGASVVIPNGRGDGATIIKVPPDHSHNLSGCTIYVNNNPKCTPHSSVGEEVYPDNQ